MSLADQASLLLIPSGYKSQKVYSIFPTDGDGDFDFSRSGSATRIAKNGLITTVDSNIPRLEYPMIDGVQKGCPSLILEPQSTNLVTYSEDFSQWAKNSGGTGTAPVVTTNDTISPDGTQNADKVVFDKGTSYTTADLSILTTSFTSQSNTASIYIKADSPQRIVIRNSSTWVGYDIGTEWTRIEKTDTGGSLQIGLRDGYGIADVPSTATVYLWGAQVEEQSYATSYIPTNGSTVTRSAETANGSGDAATFNDSEGVLMAEISALDSESTNKMITISNGSNSTRILIRYVGTTLLAQLRISGANQYEFGYDPTNIKDNFKIAIKYKANDFSFFVNGFELDSSNSGSTFSDGTLTELAFDDGGGSNDFYGNTKQVQYYNSALTDSELEQLTSWTSFTDMAEGQLYTIE
jgi:hypothetical protein